MKTFISYVFIAFLLLASSSTITKQEQVNHSSTSGNIQQQEKFNPIKKTSKNKEETLSARVGKISKH